MSPALSAPMVPRDCLFRSERGAIKLRLRLDQGRSFRCARAGFSFGVGGCVGQDLNLGTTKDSALNAAPLTMLGYPRPFCKFGSRYLAFPCVLGAQGMGELCQSMESRFDDEDPLSTASPVRYPRLLGSISVSWRPHTRDLHSSDLDPGQPLSASLYRAGTPPR